MSGSDWTYRYMRIPFVDRGATRAGCDCWGLCALIFAEQLGIMLPDYTNVAAGDWRGKVRQITQTSVAGEEWEEITAGAERAFDVVLMRGQFRHEGRAHSRPVHVGVVVYPGVLIHIEHGVGVTMVPYRRHMLIKNRVQAFYRWRGEEQGRGQGALCEQA
jgi:cell wall-associated NlpC family hydrolase